MFSKKNNFESNMKLSFLLGLNTFLLSPLFSQGKTEKPNVLFIAVDDLNDWIGTMKGYAKTPVMDRFASRGTQFSNAHCSQPVSTASRNSLLSGLHPSSTGWYVSTENMRLNYDEVMQNHAMLPEYFKNNGYKTMTAGKIFHSGFSDFPDKTNDFWSETFMPSNKGPKFGPFPPGGSQITNHYGKDFKDGNTLCWAALERNEIPGELMYDEVTTQWAVDKLKEKHDTPFFLALGYLRPHVPFTVPKAYFDLYKEGDIRMPAVPENEMSDIPLMGKSIAFGTLKTGDHYAVMNLSDTYWKELIHAYLACISFVDDQLGKVLTALENSAYADNTIVVLWSDHGQHLGEKKHWRKQALWEESTRVPLIFSVPGQTSVGVECNRTVSLLDIYPTLVELCGLPENKKLEGHSLVSLINNPEKEWSKPVLSTWYYMNHAVRSEKWRYICYRDGSEELYNREKDPNEHINLAGDPRYKQVIEEHRKWLPVRNALPAGSKSWKGDKLDVRIREWVSKDSIPVWLR